MSSMKILFAAVGLAVAAVSVPAIAAKAPVSTGLLNNVAVGGHDAVAYFRGGKPVLGSRDHSVQSQGAEYRFASAANRDAFQAEPARYAPQYGGYCAWAVAQGYTAPGDPKVWKIVNGKLYLNYNQDVGRKWEADVPGFIRKGDANWPRVLG
jgi:YHS domain-containing protein